MVTPCCSSTGTVAFTIFFVLTDSIIDSDELEFKGYRVHFEIEIYFTGEGREVNTMNVQYYTTCPKR